MPRITADLILSPLGLKPDLILEYEDDGLITGLYPADSPLPQDIKRVSGILCPGFVNAHCHLELSYLKGAIPEGTGMAGFVQKLQAIRGNYTEEQRVAAIQTAIEDLWEGGVQAVGDICNGDSSLGPKQSFSQMWYHNFIELFGLDPGKADEIVEQGQALLQQFKGMPASLTLHAPYSMSLNLRDRLLEYAHYQEKPLSLHFLESREERQLFEELDGPLMDFIRWIGVGFQAHTYASPVDLVFEKYRSGGAPFILVHNTEIREEELRQICDKYPEVFFALCPLANQYIHGTHPPMDLFERYPERVCLGTDSLAGNHQLDMLAEMLHLQEVFPSLGTEQLLNWACYNGAKALQMEQVLGSLSPGKRPGILNIQQVSPSGRLSRDSEVKRIV